MGAVIRTAKSRSSGWWRRMSPTHNSGEPPSGVPGPNGQSQSGGNPMRLLLDSSEAGTGTIPKSSFRGGGNSDTHASAADWDNLFVPSGNDDSMLLGEAAGGASQPPTQQMHDFMRMQQQLAPVYFHPLLQRDGRPPGGDWRNITEDAMARRADALSGKLLQLQ